MNICPSPHLLEELLSDGLGRAEVEAVEAHVETCAGCQQALERLTGHPNTRAVSGEATPANSCGAFLRQLEAQPPIGVWAFAGPNATATLQPTAGDRTEGKCSEPLPDVEGYQVLRELGRGGMGVVYSCLDLDLDRPLAVKVLLARHRDRDELKRRFLEEAQIMAHLQHPGVAPLHEIGRVADGRPFFSMKQVQGQTLADLLGRPESAPTASAAESSSPAEHRSGCAKARAKLSDLPRLLSIFEQVCQAMGYAHAQGIIHRDLKPANIMVGKFGEVQVMDWGLAKRFTDCDLPPSDTEQETLPDGAEHLQSQTHNPKLTELGRVLGTPAYMAPEQARGEIANLDARSDVFGLGAILCEILTGQPPFPADTQIASHRRAQRGDVSEAFARLDGCGAEAELVKVARQCLAVDKDRRPANGGVVAETMAAHRARVRERLRNAELDRAAAQARAAAERRRRRVVVALAGLAIVFLMAVAGAGAWYYEDRAALAEEEIGRQAEQARQDADRAAHHEALELQITTALDEAGQLQQQLHKQLRDPLAVHELLSDLELWTARVNMADGAWLRANALAAGAVLPLRAELAARLDTVGKERQADRKDHDLARELDDLRGSAATQSTSGGLLVVKAKVCDSYEKIFLREGYDVKKGDVKEMAARMRQSQLRFVLVTALDYWAELTEVRLELERLLELARAADPDPWRDQLRDVMAWFEARALMKLTTEVDPARQSPTILNALCSRLVAASEREAGAALLRKALLHHPRDYWLHHNLGLLVDDPKVQVGCYYAALAVRPKSGWAHNNLAMALDDLNDLEGAVAHYQKAVAYNPKFPNALSNYGALLKKMNDVDGAVAMYEEALKVDPNFVPAHSNLGNILKHRGDLEGAIALYQKALALYANLDDVQRMMHKKAVANIHHSLGLALDANKEFENAVIHHDKALAMNPQFAAAYAGLGQSLLNQGKFAEAKEATLLALKYVGANQKVRNFAETQLKDAEQYLVADQKLAAILKGVVRPASAMEQVGLAYMCQKYKHHYATAVKFYADAFAAQASLLDQPPYRYLAGCAAALAGAGKGKDVDALDNAARAKLRQQALDWLKGELGWRHKQCQSGTVQGIVAVVHTMPLWQGNPDLASVRDDNELAKLPEAERLAWQKFWTDVAALHKQSKDSHLETHLPGKLNGKLTEHVHELTLTARKTYVFELMSKQFDTYLRLLDAEGKTLSEDDDGGADRNARITFRPTEDGVYRLVATSYQQKGVGAYTLIIREFAGKEK